MDLFNQIDIANPKHISVITKEVTPGKTRVTIDICGNDGVDLRLGFYICNSQTENDTP